MEDRRRRPVARGLGQWPAVVAAWGVYGALVLALALPPLVGSPLPTGQKLAATLFLLFVLAAEAILLALASGGLEVAAPGRAARWILDALRAAAGAGLLVLLAASLVKYRFTSVHLRSTDLWFAWHNLRQIGAEALGSESRWLTALGVGGATVALLLFAGLRLLRRHPAAAPAGRLALLGVVLAAGALATAWRHPAVTRAAADFLPELAWAQRRLPDLRPRTAAAADPPAKSVARGPEIRPYAPPPPASPHHVVLVMLESIPWSRTSLAGGPPSSPHLAALAAESVVFTRAYTASTHSDYAQMAILSSLHPRKYDHHDYYTDLPYPRTLLWDALAPAGWASAVFSCQNERWGNMIRYLLTPGLGLVRHSLDWPDARHKGRGIESKVYEETPVEAWKRWFAAADRPTLTYLNFQANHFPYEVPPEAPRPFGRAPIDFPASFFAYPPERVPVMLRRFHNALAYSDRWLGEVIAHLRRLGEWERTILVVVSDHGEAFYEHAQPTHGTSLHEEQVRSVLVVRAPGVAPRRIEEPVALLDVPPLVLELVGLPPHGNFQGRGDVLESGYAGGERPIPFTIQGVTVQDGVLEGDLKLILDHERREVRLFDLAADPGERVDLAGERPAEAARLRATLEELVARQLDYYREERWRQGRYPPKLP